MLFVLKSVTFQISLLFLVGDKQTSFLLSLIFCIVVEKVNGIVLVAELDHRRL